ncbi:agrin-like [Limulus polyphemus]|uniref:Agrin-like n=1 Tax=Limulus polyphemus TaxID=6850 RepID=A0ABM1BBG7_LIMPO|nr:agrin-like [Limulus polyphemus]
MKLCSYSTLYFAVFLSVTKLGDIVQTRRHRQQDVCQKERLKLRERFADVVLTGTVERVLPNLPVYSADVLVKWVLKGDDNLRGTVLVNGFGNPDICNSHVQPRDTRIFFLHQLSDSSLHLNSSLMHINVPKLDRIRAALRDEPYTRRPEIKDEPCEKKYCPYNADCVVKRFGRASCQCPKSCPWGYKAVCASDGITYSSPCRMRVETCRKQRRAYLQHDGPCKSTSTLSH